MGPHFRARPPPSHGSRHAVVAGAQWLVHPTCEQVFFVVDSPCGTREKEKRRKRSFGVRMAWIVVIVVSFVWVSEPGNASRNFDRKLRSTLRALCAGDPDIRRTRAARHICPNVSVRESSSFEIVNWKCPRSLLIIYAFFVWIIASFEETNRRKTSLNLPRRGVAEPRWPWLWYTKHITPQLKKIVLEIESQPLFIVISQARAWSDRCFYTPFLCRNKHRMILYLGIFSNIANWRSTVFSLSPAFFLEYQTYPLRVSAIYYAPLGETSNQSLNGCVCDNTAKTRELCKDERIENNRTWSVV